MGLDLHISWPAKLLSNSWKPCLLPGHCFPGPVLSSLSSVSSTWQISGDVSKLHLTYLLPVTSLERPSYFTGFPIPPWTTSVFILVSLDCPHSVSSLQSIPENTLSHLVGLPLIGSRHALIMRWMNRWKEKKNDPLQPWLDCTFRMSWPFVHCITQHS